MVSLAKKGERSSVVITEEPIEKSDNETELGKDKAQQQLLLSPALQDSTNYSEGFQEAEERFSDKRTESQTSDRLISHRT